MDKQYFLYVFRSTENKFRVYNNVKFLDGYQNFDTSKELTKEQQIFKNYLESNRGFKLEKIDSIEPIYLKCNKVLNSTEKRYDSKISYIRLDRVSSVIVHDDKTVLIARKEEEYGAMYQMVADEYKNRFISYINKHKIK